MQPTDHMSTALEYLVEPSRISGALYHLVATYSVKTGGPSSSLMAIDLANPKSASLHWHYEFKRMLLGLRSRWINSPECKYFSALSIWYTMYFLWISSRMPALMTTCRSNLVNMLPVSMKSNTRYRSLLFSALIMFSNRMMFSWPTTIRQTVTV